MDVAARSSMCAGEDMWCVRFMRCKRDIERLEAMSELKLCGVKPVRGGRGETQVRRGAQAYSREAGKPCDEVLRCGLRR